MDPLSYFELFDMSLTAAAFDPTFLDPSHPTCFSDMTLLSNFYTHPAFDTSIDLSMFENGDLLESFLFDSPSKPSNSSSDWTSASATTSPDLTCAPYSPESSYSKLFSKSSPITYASSECASETDCHFLDSDSCTERRSSPENPPPRRANVTRKRKSRNYQQPQLKASSSNSHRKRQLKALQCSFCDNGHVFVRKQDLQRHEATHSQVKKFVCPQEGCGFGFVRRDALTRHIKSRVCSK